MDKLKIVKVSCCGANELLDIDEVVNFIKNNPNVEVGIGVSREKCSLGMPRFKWILGLQERLKENKINTSQIALHVNGIWSKEVVEKGYLPEELSWLIQNNQGAMRVQLNVVGSGYDINETPSLPLSKLINFLSKEQLAKFIIPANKYSFSFIKRLEQNFEDSHDKYDLLYDSSFGMGKSAENYVSYFPNHLQGYAGGLSDENVQDELIKINDVQKGLAYIWVDAENKLKKDNLNTLDLAKAQKFANKAFEMNYFTTLEESF